MLNVLGGLGKLAGSLGLPVGGDKGGERSVAAAGGPGDSRPPGPQMAADTDATLQSGRASGIGLDSDAALQSGRTSGIGPDSTVTLEGIASTLNRIYSAQVA